MIASEVFLIPALGCYYREDVAYLQQNPVPVENRYTTPSSKQGFVRVPSEIMTIGTMLDDGTPVWGDVVGVAFGGKSGRESHAGVESLTREFGPAIRGLIEKQDLHSYREFWQTHEAALRKLPLAVQYGISQVVIAAAARANRRSMSAQWQAEWNLPKPTRLPGFHGSCGTDRYHGAIKMMVHRLPSHPAGQGDNMPEVLGTQGEKLLEYIEWWKKKVVSIDPKYKPVFHFDLHGLIGNVFGDLKRVAAYLQQIEKAAAPYRARIESPVVARSRIEQIETYVALKLSLRKSSCSVQLVVDEWANTLSDISEFLDAQAADWIHIKMPDLGPLHDSGEAILACKNRGVGALLGGSCIETHTSATASYHLGLAFQPDLIMLKPGMGFDEALSLATSEMRRALFLN